MKINVGKLEDGFRLSFGITFWKHRDYGCMRDHFHIVIDFLFWYIQLTWRETNE